MAEQIIIPTEEVELKPGACFLMGNDGTLWRELDVDPEGMTVLVIADKKICQKPYHDCGGEVKWENSSLRTWLNGEYFESNFSESEKDAIIASEVHNADDAGSDTNDRIFLLSRDEADRYFKENEDRATGGQWWLRTTGSYGDYAAYVASGGVITSFGTNVKFDNDVRPVFRMDLKSTLFCSVNASTGKTTIKMHVPQMCIQGTKLVCVMPGMRTIAVPEGVAELGENCFAGLAQDGCVKLPATLQKIGTGALNDCMQISYAGAKCHLYELVHMMDDKDAGKLFSNRRNWDRLTPQQQARVYLTKRSKPMLKLYAQLIKAKKADELAKAIAEMLDENSTAKDYGATADFLISFYTMISTDSSISIYARLKGSKNAKKALQKVEDLPAVMQLIGEDKSPEKDRTPAEEKLFSIMQKTRQTETTIKNCIKEYYAIEIKSLPSLKCADGTEAPKFTLAWLLQIHEEKGSVRYKHAGICPEAEEIVALLDGKSLQNALVDLADNYLWCTGHSSKMYLAYPICRYADENTMEHLTEMAPKWASRTFGIDAPPLRTFRDAAMYSNTRAAMLFAEKYHELAKYAALRRMNEDTVRDRFLSDVGMNQRGCKQYELGNQTVTVRLQNDLTFVVEVPGTAKSLKSIPKKGADPDKYEAAKADFEHLKKDAKKIVKTRIERLFEDFLSGKSRKAAEWKKTYIENPLLRSVAGLLVWMQEKATFTLCADGKACNAYGTEYVVTDKPIVVAHPVEMTKADVKAWQTYFNNNRMKQPFAQVWEQSVNPAEISADRYNGSIIPDYRFKNMQKHGIIPVVNNSHSKIIGVSLDGCTVETESCDNECLIIRSFKFDKYTRRVNHIVAYLDRITVSGRILKDDVTVEPWLDEFTLPQILEFIDLAAKNNCPNVSALLQEYKQEHFENADPMDAFTLDLL